MSTKTGFVTGKSAALELKGLDHGSARLGPDGNAMNADLGGGRDTGEA